MKTLLIILGCILSIYVIYNLTRDVLKFSLSFYIKWIKGECRHICVLCNKYKLCDLQKELNADYQDGFTDGYDTAYQDEIRIDSNAYQDGYRNGFEDGKVDNTCEYYKRGSGCNPKYVTNCEYCEHECKQCALSQRFYHDWDFKQ